MWRVADRAGSWVRNVLCLCLAWVAGGCGALNSPIGTAVTDLTFEGRSHNTFWIDFSEYHSIKGLVPAQDVGTLYLSPKSLWSRRLLAPSFAMGFVADTDEKSFRLIGQTPTVPSNKEMDGGPEKEPGKRVTTEYGESQNQ